VKVHTETYVDSPKACDYCKFEGVDKQATVDGATKNRGPWAYMCDEHFALHGVGLGLGAGQRLLLRGRPSNN
jgi:hypothetical protein